VRLSNPLNIGTPSPKPTGLQNNLSPSTRSRRVRTAAAQQLPEVTKSLLRRRRAILPEQLVYRLGSSWSRRSGDGRLDELYYENMLMCRITALNPCHPAPS
jgi:hypothetical protein